MNITYYLKAFGFNCKNEYLNSTFGYIDLKVISVSAVIGILKTFIGESLGFNLLVFLAFVTLNILEFWSGIRVARKNKIAIESRKMGRMFLKVGTYVLIICILNMFMQHLKFPVIFGHEIDPFFALYWGFLIAIIYQLLKSLAENYEALGYKEMRGFLGLLKRISLKYKLENEDDNSSK